MAKKSNNSNGWGLNKVSFWTMVFVAILYAVAAVLAALKTGSKVVAYLQGVATAIMIIVVAILAWRYVKPKEMVWKVLYVIALLIVLAGIVIPLVL